MSLAAADIQQLAAWAHIDLSPAASRSFAADLQAMLDICAALTTIDTGGVTPLIYPGDTSPGLLRPDEAEPGLTTADALANTADAIDGYFRVPPMLTAAGPTGEASL